MVEAKKAIWVKASTHAKFKKKVEKEGKEDMHEVAERIVNVFLHEMKSNETKKASKK